jgi:hypothetical protein
MPLDGRGKLRFRRTNATKRLRSLLKDRRT